MKCCLSSLVGLSHLTMVVLLQCVIRVYSKLQLISTNTSTDNIYQGKHVLFSLIVSLRAHC